ncbi:glycosyltransferase 61 family protein, partial [Paracoccus nototheniae]
NSSLGNWPSKVYLSRSALSDDRRGLPTSQEKDIENIFSSFGFTVIHPQRLSLYDQAAVMQGAERIAGCIGTQLHLSAFSGNPVEMFRISPSYFTTETDKNIVKMIGGNVTDLTLNRATPEGIRNKTGFEMQEGDFTVLKESIEEWLSK